MSYKVAFQFPSQGNFVHMDEITEAPYQVRSDFVELARNVDDFDYGTTEFYSMYPSMNEHLGLMNDRVKNTSRAGAETVKYDGYFRSSGWHFDAMVLPKITTFATSTPTECAQGEIEYLVRDRTLSSRFKNITSSSKRRPEDINITLSILNEAFGDDWLAAAGGLIDISKKQKHEMSKLVRVSNLAIMQVMPCVAVTSKVRSFLHRTAPWHESQPKERVFGRTFSK